MTEQEALLRKISASSFCALDLHLYLDSHPGDCEAAAKLDEARRETQALTAKYEAAYGPLNDNQSKTSRWAWITNPWPWDV